MDKNLFENSCFKEVQLISCDNGLTLAWKEISQSACSRLPFSILLSTTATDGNYYVSLVPVHIYMKLVTTSKSYQISDDLVTSYIVCCNSGEIFVGDLMNGGTFAKLCQITSGNIIWAEFTTSHDCICLLDRTGNVHIGRYTGMLYEWQSLCTSFSMRCCVKVENTLIASDGCSSFLCTLFDEESKFKFDEYTLPFCGVQRITKDESNIVMTCFDGRCYQRTLLELTSEFSDKSTKLFLNNLNLSDVLLIAERSSNAELKESCKLRELDLYLEQISLVQRLVNLPNGIFEVRLDIAPSLEKEHSFFVLVDIALSSAFRFEGPWWQLQVKLEDCPFVNLVCVNLSQFDACNHVRFPLYIPQCAIYNLTQPKVGKKLSSSFLFSVILCDFFSLSPVLTARVHTERVDMIHFLTLFPNSSSLVPKSFQTVLSKLLPASQAGQSPKTYSRPFKQSIIINVCDNLRLLSKVFPKLDIPECSSNVLWLFNISIAVSCERAGIYFKVTLESSSRSLIVGVKMALEGRLLHTYKCSKIPGPILLPPEILTQTRISRHVLHLETVGLPSKFVIKRLYGFINDLVSNLPL